MQLLIDLPDDLPPGHIWIRLDRPLPPEGVLELELRDSVGAWNRRCQARVVKP